MNNYVYKILSILIVVAMFYIIYLEALAIKSYLKDTSSDVLENVDILEDEISGESRRY